MIIKTKGIVLSYIKYGETSIICKIFTETISIQTFIINGIRKSKSKNIALYQPLTILDLVIYHKESSGIQRIKEAKLDVIYKTLHLDIKKISNLLGQQVKQPTHKENKIKHFMRNRFVI